MLKGAIHIHSTYSDGEFTLPELREIMIADGCRFVCMTDHAEFFDEQKLGDYIRECESLSDDSFRFVPGLEYTCNGRMHVLGLGVTSTAGTTDPQEVIRQIETRGGVSVIAHPMDSMFDMIEKFEALPSGVEAWNSKYDGRYAPRPGTFRLIERLQERKPELRAFYGIDLHWRKQFRGLLNVLRTNELTRDTILSSLSSGDFMATKGELVMSSRGELSPALLEHFEKAHSRSDRLRGFVKTLKKVTRRAGLTPPTALKTHLRRIF